MKKRLSLLDVYKNEIKHYISLGLSIRCIYILINEKMKKEGLYISYQSVRNYIAKIKGS
jgi:hypothetical protein